MKKIKKIVLLLMIIVLIMLVLTRNVNISDFKIAVEKQDFLSSPLNEVIDVGQDVYVQHDSQNKDVYILSSQGNQTTVYKILNVKYTANKQWTTNGLFIDDFTECNCATGPNDYINVSAGEKYFVRLYGVSDIYTGPNGDLWEITTPILFMDNNNNVIGDALRGTYTDSKEGVEITIPNGATRMHITNYNNQGISIQKKITLNQQQFNEIKNKQNQILNSLDSNYQAVKNDPILFDKPDKSYVVFVIDDTREDINQFADLFHSKGVPLSLATISDNLSNMASNHTETRLDVALRVQADGGEILTHNADVITQNNINDNEFVYKYFVGEKQKLKSMGFDVKGILLAGGDGQVLGSPITAKWAYSLYEYSDLLGEEYNSIQGYNSVYYAWRNWLGNYNNSQFQSYIDDLIRMKEWDVFFFHDESEVSLADLSNYLDYINSKGTDKIEVVTYSRMYQNFAKRESDILNDLYGEKTYYVSANGTSTDGTDINNPTNLETLSYKEIKSGDTILFKCGDTFYSDIDLDINNTDNRKITISSYGTGERPTFSAYKYIGNNWQKYNNNVYRIDIKNTNNFSGYKLAYNNDAYNVGFLEDDNGNKYYNKKNSIDSLSSKYDFYSDGEQYLYLYTNTNPYNELGNIKAAVKTGLLYLRSNMDISNLRLAYSGGHGIVGGSQTLENIKISNCIIENIGGSYLFYGDTTRYGNGLEFYESNTSNVEVCNNIFRNIYDVAFTMQGSAGSGTNILVHDNVFVSNSQDSEIWEDPPATGINNYQFYNNISINQGRGWGYEARPDKDYASHILFWEYHIEPTDIYFHNNIVYNPRRIYFIERINGTVPFFKNYDYIKSDYNAYYLASDAKIYDYLYPIEEKDNFIAEYNKDVHSTFESIDVNQGIVNTANNSDDIEEIRALFEHEDYLFNIETPAWSSLPISQTRTLKAVFNPAEAGVGKTITWSSRNTNIATIDSSTGKVTAKANGTTIITASDGEKTSTYTLTVNGILGDSDSDSEITAFDAYKALMVSVNLILENQENADEVVCLDVDRDEEVTAWDAYRILLYSIGSISEF